ncbi:MAG: hypothetical protein HYY06_28255 [Deltaproteobacteria bacterium]|nr:hypothetical protein [Deltaproteobacteria bacterium]
MKIVSAREAKEGFAECGEASQKDLVVVTKYGRPFVLMVGVQGKDLEQIVLGMDDELWETIEARRHQPELLSHDEVRRSLGVRRRRPR